MDRKLFSIITPTYNSGLKLEKTLNSVLSQGPDLLEYIVVDGGSTDETLPLLETYGDKLKVISERDAGVYDAMNFIQRLLESVRAVFYFCNIHFRLRL